MNFPQTGDSILSTQDQTLLTDSGYLAYGSSFWPSNLIAVSQNAIDEINARQFQYVGLPRFYTVSANRINFAPTFSAIELVTPITGGDDLPAHPSADRPR